MMQVVLIGDSIRMGYEATVREALQGVADVWSPEQNGGNSVNILIHLHLWAVQRQPDLIHINCGLHDLRTILYGGRENVVPLSQYRDNVARILRTLREHTNARLIWATTTPVHDARAHAAHAHPQDFDRYNEDVIAYNQAATAVATDMGIAVDDLYTVVMQAGSDACLREDGVHYTPEGYQLLGTAVAQAIRDALPIG